MKVYTLPLGEISANCYIVQTDSDRCIAIDIGGDSEELMEFINGKKLKLSKILLTHGHFDHIGGVADIQKITGAEVYIHTDDAYMLESEKASLASKMSLNEFKPVKEYIAVAGDCIINDGDYQFKVMHTPGHTSGGVCYICNDVIFSGDTLFRNSIGRTDLSGNDGAMHNSLIRLAGLKGDYKVYPGHGESTTLDYERRNNPYMIRL